MQKLLGDGMPSPEHATSTGLTQPAPPEGETAAVPATDASPRIAELDAYWAEVSRAVNEGDFAAYQASCHEEGVLVSGSKQYSQPLATALARWKQEFMDTRDGKISASVKFRFSRRIGDATTAHETGIFRYSSQTPGAEPKTEYIHFEALLVKQRGVWKILMENQQGPATEAAWNALK
jgi:hypothetical protein